MPITDRDVADLCAGIYAYPSLPAVTWDRFDDGEDSDQICWGVKVVDDCDVPPQYVHPTPLVDVSAPPPPDDEWGIFGYHHMQLYTQAVAR